MDFLERLEKALIEGCGKPHREMCPKCKKIASYVNGVCGECGHKGKTPHEET